MNGALYILYVRDQEFSTRFYTAVLNQTPVLYVPGMTQYTISDTCQFGLMPEAGIKKLLGEALPDPARANGIPRNELYLMVDKAQPYLDRALQNGAKLISEISMRDWGQRVGYCLDIDGHVLAFADDLDTD